MHEVATGGGSTAHALVPVFEGRAEAIEHGDGTTEEHKEDCDDGRYNPREGIDEMADEKCGDSSAEGSQGSVDALPGDGGGRNRRRVSQSTTRMRG